MPISIVSFISRFHYYRSSKHNEFDLVEDSGMRSIYRRETRKISDEEEGITGRREGEETGLLGMAGILFLLHSFPSFSYPSSSPPPRTPSSHSGVTGHDKLVGIRRAEEAHNLCHEREKRIFLFLFLSFFFLNFLPLHSKIYIIFFKDLDGNFIYIHSYILASNFFSSFVRTFI